jgi:23S rRNA (uracil1939-C5)-methyltransferase
VADDFRCGGNVFRHIEYRRQLTLKGEIIQDAFRRIGRIPLADPPVVEASPERGYRMRARLHVAGGRIGFYLEGTHQVCDAAATGQLLPETCEWIAEVQSSLDSKRLQDLTAIEVAEDIPGRKRAAHLELHAGADPADYAAAANGLVGLSAERADRPGVVRIAGTPVVTDVIHVDHDPSHALALSRDARAFFQGNRFLVERLVRRVLDQTPRNPVIDLYAGVGLFGLSLAVAGWESITAVEGDLVAGSDLIRNAQPIGRRVVAIRRSVESYLASARRHDISQATVIVDPPRTGISKEAIAHLMRFKPPRIVYVSCDVATLARDSRVMHEAGYHVTHINGIDLFPNTAHVETIAVLTR